jgi:hypothetical protein
MIVGGREGGKCLNFRNNANLLAAKTAKYLSYLPLTRCQQPPTHFFTQNFLHFY